MTETERLEIERITGMTDAECEYWDRHIIEHPEEFCQGPNLVDFGYVPGRDFVNAPKSSSMPKRELATA